MDMLGTYFSRLRDNSPVRWRGRVVEASGQTIESVGPPCSVGECCEIRDRLGAVHAAEAIGFRDAAVIAMTLDAADGVRYGDALFALGNTPRIEVGPGLIGRVMNAVGQPLDGARRPVLQATAPLERAAPAPLDRTPIRDAAGTGIRAIDGVLSVGRGQRIGIFGGSGVGKSTLIGMMTRNSDAEVIVVGLVGERGREVGEFLEESLGVEGRKRAVVLVSTSDQSPLLRMRAALGATSVAEYFASMGKHVLLVLDSLTRFAMAAREVGLAAGEPPTTRGYTPSVFSRLARLVERAGQFRTGSITAFYTVLMEGDDLQDPLVDAVRSYLDGHVVLSRRLAAEGWYPPIDVVESISRLMPVIVTEEHGKAAATVRRLIATWQRSEDLVRIGAYKAGTDADLDRALQFRAAIRAYLVQRSGERETYAGAMAGLLRLAASIEAGGAGAGR
ncbi:MAG TPA: FliI/YscN family ATPase [Acidobacteriaceae bacterium]|jgi:flagellum-specific ATP synthase|nr:FliI/YscN family ATPase [Acidobacteriaceae bacterium]